jgi:hypothetical protein
MTEPDGGIGCLLMLGAAALVLILAATWLMLQPRP